MKCTKGTVIMRLYRLIKINSSLYLFPQWIYVKFSEWHFVCPGIQYIGPRHRLGEIVPLDLDFAKH